MKNFCKYLLFALVAPLAAFGTHNRAAEITFRQLGNLTYEVTIVVYVKESSNIQRDTLSVDWGDNITSRINKISQTTIPGKDITKRLYRTTHTYPANGNFIISFVDQNRNGNIVNIPTSVSVPFYTETQLRINPFLGYNNSPVLLQPPIDDGCKNQIFTHNPTAYDPDGDSLSYELTECKSAQGQIIPGYIFPKTSKIFAIDPTSGTLTWDSPTTSGEYNVAIIIKEWRKINGIRKQIGYVVRDMQITISECNNNAPKIAPLNDLCVQAGDSINKVISATDPDNDVISFSATGGPFEVAQNKASFSTLKPLNTATFEWYTICQHLRKQPYLVTIKAEDNNSKAIGVKVPLSDLKSFQIQVVPPKPVLKSLVVSGKALQLNWNSPACTGASKIFIYRKIGPENIVRSKCEAGMPDKTAYQLIYTSLQTSITSYIDDDMGKGLIPGLSYCYRIVIQYGDDQLSRPSEELCNELPRTLPIITKISVGLTSTSAGIDTIQWKSPQDLDQQLFPAPYKYVLFRAKGINPTNALAIDSLSSNDIKTADTSLSIIHKGNTSLSLNTQDSIYSYKISFFSQNKKVGETPFSSSTFLQLSQGDHKIVINASFKDLWTNYSYHIYKKEQNAGNFQLLAISSSLPFVDTAVKSNTTYCYYLIAKGKLFGKHLGDSTTNYSQEYCAQAIDIQPIQPNISIIGNCKSIESILKWKYPDGTDTSDIKSYHIYYKNDDSEPWPKIPLATILAPANSFAYDGGSTGVVGCYTVVALSRHNIESAYSKKACIDNCPEYLLPNLFTPNNDGKNDLFEPIINKGVYQVDMRIFNRWGQLVYKTNDPQVKWDGHDLKGGMCSDGTYFYVCDVKEKRLSSTNSKGIKGFVQLINGSK